MKPGVGNVPPTPLNKEPIRTALPMTRMKVPLDGDGTWFSPADVFACLFVAGFSPGPWIVSAMFHRETARHAHVFASFCSYRVFIFTWSLDCFYHKQTAARRNRIAWLLKPKLHMFKHMLKHCLRWRLLAAVHSHRVPSRLVWARI